VGPVTVPPVAPPPLGPVAPPNARSSPGAPVNRSPPTITGTSTATTRQIKAALVSALTPSGKEARIVTLLRTGHYSFFFTAPAAGALRITWWLVPKGPHSRKHRPKPILVATGQLTFSTARTAQITVNLTSAGKQLLKHATAINLTARGSFRRPGQPTTIATEIIALRR
jgi:hypothetical protein